MKRPPLLLVRFLLAVSACSLLTGCMSVRRIGPEKGLPGTIVEIQGSGFNPVPAQNQVTIGGSTARVISGTSNRLRVVALRDVATGRVAVRNGTRTATSSQTFKRDGTTTRATPLQDSDSELIVGQGYPVDRRYDMSAQGLNQKILVVLAKPSDVDPETLAPMGVTARDSVTPRLASANTFFQQASYNKTSVAFTMVPDWISLSKTRDFYCWQQEDIDRAQAALDALMLDPNATQAQIDEAKNKLKTAQGAQATLQEPDYLYAEALIGAKAAVADFDTYTDYFFVVAGPFLRGQCCWMPAGIHVESTLQGLKFDIDFPNPKGITYVSQQADWGRMAHELSHFFAGGDLYGGASDASAAPFDLMGNHDSHPLYSGYNMEKRLDYFNEGANGNVQFLQWGSVPDLNQTFDLVAHAKTEDPAGDTTKHILSLKVTEGLYYFVEVRQKPDAAVGPAADYVFDPSIPLDASNPAWLGGVIISKAVESNNQSNNNERQITLLPPRRMLQVGESVSDPARTIRITVEQKLADRPTKYRVRVEWGHLPAADPNGQFDLRITPWSPPPWETPDIWANSTKNDETSPAKIIYKNHEPGDETKPVGNGDPPWVGHNNTLFARITNQGMVATPQSVKVTFYVNTPPGIGDNGTWAPFDTVDVGILNQGETKIVMAARPWNPSVGEHTCVKVFIEPQTGEVTFDNNQAQENFGEFETAASSPYQAVELDFLARNPYDTPGVMDILARNVPTDWFVALSHGSVWLQPKGEKKVHAVIWTDRDAEWASDRKTKSPRKPLIELEGWMDRWFDQNFAIGGVTAFMQAVRKVDLQIEVRQKEGQRDEAIWVTGQVTPSVGVVPVAVHVTNPDGKVFQQRLQTDSTGNFTIQLKAPTSVVGSYKIQAFVLGGALAGEVESSVRTLTIH